MELYEIRLLIVSELDKDDLLSCVSVSKHWLELFTPFLYTKCRISDSNSHPGICHWLSFQKYLHHVSDFAIDEPISASECDLILKNCHSLRRLELSTPLPSDFSIQLLEGNPLLTEVRLYEPLEIIPEMIETIAQQCRHVAVLGISGLKLNGLVLERFLRDVAPGLKEIELRSWSDTFSPCKWTAHRKPNLPLFPELRNLIVKGLPENDLSIQCEVFLRLFELNCPKLESMAWEFDRLECFCLSEFIVTLTVALQQRVNINRSCDRDRTSGGSSGCGCCWPRLDSIKIENVYPADEVKISDEIFAELLSSCQDHKLRRLCIMQATFKTKSFRALEPHFGTLEVLSLSTSSWQIQRILSSCPQLREIMGGEFDAGEIVEGFRAEEMRVGMADTLYNWLAKDDETLRSSATMPWSDPRMPPLPWVCHGLQVLRFPIYRMRYADAISNHQTLDRLVQLKELRELNIQDMSLRPKMSSPGYSGLTRETVIRYPGFELDSDVYSQAVARLSKELSTPQQIRKWAPIGPKLLKIWPNLTHCRLNK
ncbi:hypothetical protein BGZ83_001767 [Gryganskiella cystojenkinii]|nr:hypothetical protein BGZ83_001767 [Gryganskiella cystojenkinii]